MQKIDIRQQFDFFAAFLFTFINKNSSIIIICLQHIFRQQDYVSRYKSNYNVSFFMQKFRSHKSRLIHSKRDSQKIDQLDLFTLKTQSQLPKNCFNLAGLMHQKLYTITQQHYKINKQQLQNQDLSLPSPTLLETVQKDAAQLYQQSAYQAHSALVDTFKTENVKDTPGSDSNMLGNILNLMKTINILQQKCTASSDKSCDPIKKQIKNKVTQFKELLGQFQNSFQSSLLDFYNEQNQDQDSPKSFNSRSSEQSEPENTDREAYEMAERQDYKKLNGKEEARVQLKYRRITESTQSLDTFGQDAEKDYQSPQKELISNDSQDKQTKELNQSSIVHLFSYQKQKCLQSPLPSITQRSSQYCSPESKYPGSQLFSQSLEYKKIFYLLQTTQKKKDTARTSNRHEVSQFLPSSRTNKSNSKNSNICESIDRSKSHSQLKDMINLLQTKYKRSFKKDSSNPKGPLDAVLNSKSIRLRDQR